MGSIKSYNLRAEKAKAIHKHRQLQKIASFFRFAEVCVVLVLISRLSFQLPIAVKNSSEYFRDVSVFIVDPRFVFLIGNVIIVALFTLSGQFSAQNSESKSLEPDFYQEFVQNSTRSLEKQSLKTEYGMKNPEIYEDLPNNSSEKQIVTTGRLEGNQIKYRENQSPKHIIRAEKNKSKKTEDTTSRSMEVTVYRRCQSGNLLSVMGSEESKPVLRRSETDNSRKKGSYPEDGMSNEEFRLTIEAFIARQQRLRMEEESYVA
ncbi:uncharacterized protein LOC114723697 [Neltuma alba]|uniref:uncharacterized protein LOC114723597 n=1 Tax=Neltuma alba TaxID=207710 RepID=UPI0010A44EBE|nr:uncharacterized protein LOC114723597 [Prosopis alba]XP_028765757.1 uncharacterized protein LOC114723697 [Prosopis alba]